uniref:Fibrinogen C-terminal domain-containing protein n=1 Tax=Biomphalaria glabrata TaxID=6526 RepID=A0A2C9LHZ4_BIOGL
MLLFVFIILTAVTEINAGPSVGFEFSKNLKALVYGRPDSCKDVFSNTSRVVVILSSGLEVMCDTDTDGGGWTIFQRRITGNLSFYRGWEEYKYGFGDVTTGEFYLGNENMHQITTKRRHELRIDLTFNQAKFSATYSRFSLYGEPEKYRLRISGYSGTAGDNLRKFDNVKFTTFDKDNDIYGGNCADLYKGAWWYTDCHAANLNGIWGSIEYGTGLNWVGTTGFYQSVSMSEMKFREI